MNTITPLTSATNLGSATSRSGGQPHWQKFLQSGEILKATVLETKGKDLFILDIGGNSIAAQSKALLSPGQTLQLQLVSASPQIELKIVSNTPQQFFGRSLTLISENIDLTGLFKSLQQAGNSPLKDLGQATVLETKGQDSYILDIGGNHIAAQSKSPLSLGQTLQLQVESLSPQVELKFSSSTQQQVIGGSLILFGDNTEVIGLVANLQQSGTSTLEGLIKATVLEVKGNDVYILDVEGNSITAQTKTFLVPGQTLQLQVVTTSPQIELKISSNTRQQFSGGSLTLVGENTDLVALLKTFQQVGALSLNDLTPITQQTLESFLSYKQNELSGKDGGKILKYLIDRTGLTLENLLASGDKENAVKTLKAALFEIAHVFKEATEIVDTTHRILGTLEVYQMAQLHLENSSNFIFPLPVPFLKQGYLIVEDYGKQKEGSESDIGSHFRFSLHLTMAELGNLRIDFLQYQDGLYIRFNTDSKEKSDFVESFSADIKQAVSSVPLLGLSFSETAADPTAELIQKLLPQGTSMLDTKI
jgi:hypothetical protein